MDAYWDLLMQRRTLREAGSDRNEAKVKDEKTSEDSLQWRCSRFTECRGEAGTRRLESVPQPVMWHAESGGRREARSPTGRVAASRGEGS